jgi:hypothetical protein
MIRLLTLRLSIAARKRSQSISKKLKARTWIALAGIHACLAIVSFWAYQAKAVPDSAIPPVDHAELRPVPLQLQPGDSLQVTLTVASNGSTPYSWGGAASVWLSSSDVPAIRGFEWNRTPSASQPFSGSIQGTNFTISGLRVFFQVNPFGDPIPKLPDFGRTTVVQAPSSEEPSLLTPFERLLALLSTIITSALAILNLFLAWQVLRRSRAEAILLRLQIEALTLENARLREDFARERRQTEKSGIILLS